MVDVKPKTGTTHQFSDSSVQQVFEHYDDPVRKRLLALRDMILDEAARHPEIGEVRETLKWGQPSYLPARPRIGTTLRIDRTRNNPAQVGLYFTCNSTLGDDFRQLYSGVFEFEGNRAILISVDGPLPERPLRHCIALALTYHLNKKR